MSNIKIEKNTFNILMKIADTEYQYWENVNKNRKQKQCFNSKQSCRIGILSEFAAKIHLMNSYEKDDIIKLDCAGIEERVKNIHHRNKADIELNIIKKDKIKEYKIEIKGIKKGQPRGQILIDHAHKYNDKNYTHVIFCEVDFKINEKTLLGEANINIYLIDQIKEIINYPIAKNLYYKYCYTHPSEIHKHVSYK